MFAMGGSVNFAANSLTIFLNSSFRLIAIPQIFFRSMLNCLNAQSTQTQICFRMLAPALLANLEDKRHVSIDRENIRFEFDSSGNLISIFNNQ